MPETNILQSFIRNRDQLGDQPCWLYKEGGLSAGGRGSWRAVSWKEAEERVQALARGLATLGLKKGDTVVLFSATRLEWTLCDLAILSLGGITVPVYQSNTAEQAAYIVRDSEAKLIFVENPTLYEKVRSLGVKVILMTGKIDEVPSLPQVMKEGGEKGSWRKQIEKIAPSDLASYVYTSGTTGPPKGAVLSHGNFIAAAEASRRLLDIGPGETALLFLPLAHILGRVMQFFQVYNGFLHAYAEGVDKLIDNLAEVKPHFFVSVPRIFERVYERVQSQARQGSPLKKKIFQWAVRIGREASILIQKKQSLPVGLKVRRAVASYLVFRKLRDRLGGRLRFAISGGAPLSPEIAEFFHAAGILILEGYGLTETTAVTNCNRLDQFKFGTVGPPTYQVEEKIASDGEILVRGPALFQGYFKKPDATREVFAEGGWFRTGDVGLLDEDQFLRITDRKKDIIVTAGGKNIAPQNIENLMKTVPYISQVMVHGDRRKFLSALVTLNREPVEKFAKERGIPYRDFKDLAENPKIHELIKKSIEEKNKQLASFESIKNFVILNADFTQEAGELTPTLKVRRKFVSEKYRDLLAKLYQE